MVKFLTEKKLHFEKRGRKGKYCRRRRWRLHKESLVVDRLLQILIKEDILINYSYFIFYDCKIIKNIVNKDSEKCPYSTMKVYRHNIATLLVRVLLALIDRKMKQEWQGKYKSAS